ncbi:MAG: hypothetical protein MUF71_10570 [Candidatus Kapabacteria bacterium]|jgi:outer membrane protein OmpA-like peptidoglycan-associated protein|nr:hypothetical protein [Candidatus Kapabacteria bacterium]
MALYFCVSSFAQEIPSQPSPSTTFYQTTPAQRTNTRLGVYGQVGWSLQAAQFLGLANADYVQVPYLDELTTMNLTENPLTWNIGLLGEIPFYESVGTWLGLAVRLNARSFAAAYASSLRYPLPGVSVPNGVIDFSLQTNSVFLGAEPLLAWHHEGLNLTLMGGISFSTYLSGNLTQRRSLRSLDGTPIDAALKAASENVAERTLGGSAFGSRIVSALTLGTSWEIPITPDGAFILAPEVFYSFALNDINDNLRAAANQSAFWRVSAVRAGVALKFAPEKPVLTPITPELVPPAPLPQNTDRPVIAQSDSKPKASENEPLRVKIASIEGVESSGKRVLTPTLKIEEFLASSSRFLLPYIFFDEHSSTLLGRYKRLTPEEQMTFTPQGLIASTFAKDHELDAYYHLLNIVGYRMQKNPTARLTLIGYTDVARERADKSLPLQRAETVKEYLQTVWNIAASRMTTKSGGAKGLTETIDAEENRMVEIQSNEPEIFAELRYEYILRTVQPPVLAIQPEVQSPRPVLSWNASIRQDTSIYTIFKGTGTPSSTTTLDWDLAKGDRNGNAETENSSLTALARGTPTKLSLTETPLDITLTASDALQSSTASGRVNVEVLTVEKKRALNLPDVRIGSYWVFCFNLSSTLIALDTRVRRIVGDIRRQIVPHSFLSITGYTDTRGNAELNQKLSTERAATIAQLIGAESMDVAGKGISELHDNTLPEGRFYNRFVRVDMRLPLEGKW